MRENLDFSVHAVEDLEAPLEDLAFVLGDDAILTLGQYHAGKCSDRIP